MEEIIKRCLPTYDVIKNIGEGVYGTVYLVKDNLKERAVKVLPIMVERSFSYRSAKALDSKISHDFYAVQEYYSKIKGDGVVEIHDFHLVDKRVSKQEAKAWLIVLMEYCPASLLNFVIDHYPLSPRLARQLMWELAEVLNRLISKAGDSFIVKDLKPSNLLINQSGRLVIGDLGGLQRLSSVSTTANAQFTPNWSAPELVIRNERPGPASLIYAYGFVAYFIWLGCLPYEKEDFTTRTRLIRESGLRFNRSDMPYNIQGLIEKCLKYQPSERPGSLTEIIAVLNGDHRLTCSQSLFADESLKNPPPAGQYQKDGAAAAPKPEPEPFFHKLPAEIHQLGDTWIEPVTGTEFLWVPTGSFRMGGGNWDGEGNKDEFPVHEVFIDGFWMGKYPVTQAQWKKVMSGAFWKKVRPHNPSGFKKGADHPVEQVSWQDAQDFIVKLTVLNKNKYHFRLPTEAEWEYAARSCGKPEKYAGGKKLEDLAWYSANSAISTRPVGQKRPNGIGLYDMSGNVYEWCQDTYLESGYKKHAQSNPVVSGKGARKVIRGGSWCNSPHEVRCAYRAGVYPDFKGNYIGFRLVMTPVSRKKSAD